MKKILTFTIMAFCLTSEVFAQNVDTERMERDLEVSKNVLQSLLGQENGYLMWSRNIEASYLEGYGVIFTLPNDYVFSYAERGMVVGVRSSGNTVDIKENEEDESGESSQRSEETKEAVTTFLVDYSDLISQLEPGAKIMVHAKSRDDVYISVIGEGSDTWSVQEAGTTNFSAEILKKDISDYKQGKISRKDVINRIKFTESKLEEKQQDLELFASIVKRLYSPDLSKTFFTSNTPRYERLEGFGVIFYMKTYSSYENDEYYRMPVLDRSDVSKEERAKTIEELYPRFEDDLKSTLIEYGRTINSLGEDEVILLKVKSTKCDGCNIPTSMELSIDKSVLTQFDQRKISLEEAKKSVKVKKKLDS